MALALAFVLGAVTTSPAWLLLGAIVADTLSVRRHRRRRVTIDTEGPDAVESWLADIDWQRDHQNGDPFREEGEPV